MGKIHTNAGKTGVQQNAGDEEMVITPGGPRPKSMVHYIEPGHHVSSEGGRLKMIHTATAKVVKDFGEIPKHNKQSESRVVRAKPLNKLGGGATPGPITDGWIINSEWTNTTGNPISYFSSKWVVPPAPATDNGQLVYLFNGIQQTNSGPFILQPVLQWGNSPAGGGSNWAITNWYVDGQGGLALHGSLVNVNPGDELQGVMTLTGQSGGTCDYQSSFIGNPTADLTVTGIDELKWANETLECYGFSAFSDYPDTDLTAFYDIEIKLRTSNSPVTDVEANINWLADNSVTDNGQQCVIVSNDSPAGEVYLYYRGVTQGMYFVTDKSTYGKDEVADVISTAGGKFTDAFWLVLEGFTKDQVTKDQPSALHPALSGAFNSLAGVTITPNPANVEYEDPADLYTPQRIRYPFDVTFTSTSMFPAVGSAPIFEQLNATITIEGNTLSAITLFELVSGADPYFTNLDPSNTHDVFYLSQDLRVFSVSAGHSPVSGAPAFTSDPYTSIQNFLGFLNSNTSFTNPGAADPLNALPGQSGYETGDSSVTPLDGASQKNYNFAIARVRLQDAALASADNVRVFFRLFVAPSFDTDFQPATTYKSTLGTSGADNGKPIFPLASGDGITDPSGQAVKTIPFFATDAAGTHDYDSSVANANIRNIVIPAGHNKTWAYFGCYLDVYDAGNQAKFPGTHHCIVAEIAYDDAPIINSGGVTMSPENSDKLAQRNLQITSSGNPSYPETHRIPQAFDMRASEAVATTPGLLLDYPDELMIDWGNTPHGSVASLYWPQINSADVLQLASSLYSTHLLAAADANTIKCQVTKGVTYIPIPVGTGKNFAGLFTLDLPQGITVGQEFNIKVRRVTSRKPEQINVVTVLKESHGAINVGGRGKPMRNWRYITGTFQVKIPVGTDKALLGPEENTLAILKWRLENMPQQNRWYPVLERYVRDVAMRVDGFGGNSVSVKPSLDGVPTKIAVHEKLVEYRGKVSEVVYNCFGDLEGFALDKCCTKPHLFKCTEKSVGELVSRACKERWTIAVFVNEKQDDKICEIRVYP
jgi:hypothetical protein